MSFFTPDDELPKVRFTEDQLWLLSNQRSDAARRKLERILLTLAYSRKSAADRFLELVAKRWSEPTIAIRWFCYVPGYPYPATGDGLYSLEFTDLTTAREVLAWIEEQDWTGMGWLEGRERRPSVEHSLYLHHAEAMLLVTKWTGEPGVKYVEPTRIKIAE